jgi:cell division protein FtsL
VSPAARGKYAAGRPVANTYLVRQRDRRRARELVAVLIALLPAGVALLAYTWIHLEVVRTGYRIDALERRLHRSAQIERQLRLEASYLGGPERVARRAASELGMRAPEPGEVVSAAGMSSR